MIIVGKRYALEIWKYYLNLVWPGKTACSEEANFELNLKSLVRLKIRDFPGGPVVKTLLSQCRGHGFNPLSGN